MWKSVMAVSAAFLLSSASAAQTVSPEAIEAVKAQLAQARTALAELEADGGDPASVAMARRNLDMAETQVRQWEAANGSPRTAKKKPLEPPRSKWTKSTTPSWARTDDPLGVRLTGAPPGPVRSDGKMPISAERAELNKRRELLIQAHREGRIEDFAGAMHDLAEESRKLREREEQGLKSERSNPRADTAMMRQMLNDSRKDARRPPPERDTSVIDYVKGTIRQHLAPADSCPKKQPKGCKPSRSACMCVRG